MELALFGALLTLVSAPTSPPGMSELKRAVEHQTGGVEFADKVKRHGAKLVGTNVPAANIALGAVQIAARKQARLRTGPFKLEMSQKKVVVSFGFSW